MTKPLSFFVGSASAPNVRRLVSNVGWMLSGLSELHLVTTTPESFDRDTLSYYETFGTGFPCSLRGEYRALTGYLESNEPGAITQLTYPPRHGTLAGLAARRRGIRFVYRYNGDRFREYTVAEGREKLVAFCVGNLLGRVPLRLADRYIALGPRGASRLTEYGADERAICILPSAVNVTDFRKSESDDADILPNVPEGRRVVLFVGRLSALKGVETLETAIPEILRRRRDLQFVIVGPPERTLSVSPEFEDHVTFTGRVAPERMPRYYRLADLLIHPSLTEGIPRSVLESLAAGTPVLARDVGDVASVTQNTFTAESEFVEDVVDLEKLHLDPVESYSREALRPRYRRFFERLC